MTSDPIGIGLRAAHYRALLERRPALALMEVHSENYFGPGGQPLAFLERFRRDYPVSLHGVGLGLGAVDPPSAQHLERLKALAARIDPQFVSDHLCWGQVDGRFVNDLLPLPYTEEALAVVCRHIDLAQTCLKRRLLIENVSSYLTYACSTIPEWEFVAAVARRTGCALLLDVNNIYVSAMNHGFDPIAYLDAIPAEAVREMHLAGFERAGELLIDTHGARVCDPVWVLYRHALRRFGVVPTVIEWDTNLPAIEVLLEEADIARRIMLDELAYAPA